MTDNFQRRYGNRNPYFEALLREGTNTAPIGAHSQGMSRLAFALLAGLDRGQMDRDEREARERMAEAVWKGGQPDQRAHHMPAPSPFNPPPGVSASLVPNAPLIPLPRPRPFD